MTANGTLHCPKSHAYSFLSRTCCPRQKDHGDQTVDRIVAATRKVQLLHDSAPACERVPARHEADRETEGHNNTSINISYQNWENTLLPVHSCPPLLHT